MLRCLMFLCVLLVNVALAGYAPISIDTNAVDIQPPMASDQLVGSANAPRLTLNGVAITNWQDLIYILGTNEWPEPPAPPPGPAIYTNVPFQINPDETFFFYSFTDTNQLVVSSDIGGPAVEQVRYGTLRDVSLTTNYAYLVDAVRQNPAIIDLTQIITDTGHWTPVLSAGLWFNAASVSTNGLTAVVYTPFMITAQEDPSGIFETAINTNFFGILTYTAPAASYLSSHVYIRTPLKYFTDTVPSQVTAQNTNIIGAPVAFMDDRWHFVAFTIMKPVGEETSADSSNLVYSIYDGAVTSKYVVSGDDAYARARFIAIPPRLQLGPVMPVADAVGYIELLVQDYLYSDVRLDDVFVGSQILTTNDFAQMYQNWRSLAPEPFAITNITSTNVLHDIQIYAAVPSLNKGNIKVYYEIGGDQGTNATLWDYVSDKGWYVGERDGTLVTNTLPNLTNGTYTYRWATSNAFGTSWSEPDTFIALKQESYKLTNPIEVSVVSTGALLVADAQQYNAGTCRVYYESGSDQGTNNISAWQDNKSYGYSLTLDAGQKLTNTLTGLTVGTTYFYRWYTTNQYGVYWSDAESFTATAP